MTEETKIEDSGITITGDDIKDLSKMTEETSNEENDKLKAVVIIEYNGEDFDKIMKSKLKWRDRFYPAIDGFYSKIVELVKAQSKGKGCRIVMTFERVADENQ